MSGRAPIGQIWHRQSWRRRIWDESWRNLMLLLLGAYRTIGTSFLGGSCRYEPSCSEYALQAVRTHEPGRAIGLIVRRLCRCRPGGSCGWDPVPSRDGSRMEMKESSV